MKQPRRKPDFAESLREELAKLEAIEAPEIIGVVLEPGDGLRRATVLLLREGKQAIVRTWAIG